VKVWVFVEGESDRLALNALWDNWSAALRNKGWGLRVLPLDTKDRFLRKIGPRAAEKLKADADDLVVGLPDYYPNAPYANTDLRHETVAQLQDLQREVVEAALIKNHRLQREGLTEALERFCPSAFKHDMEMLLLAAKEQLRRVLCTPQRLRGWRIPVEGQDQQKPPKRIVEQLFRTKTPRKRAYRETKDAPAVLRRAKDVADLLFLENGRENCPVFKAVLDWVGEKTGIPAYELSPP
jgi:hypothetical protein